MATCPRLNCPDCRARDGLLARAQQWLQPCGPCDGGLPMSCTHPTDDPRVIISELVGYIEASRPRVVTTAAELDKLVTDTDTQGGDFWHTGTAEDRELCAGETQGGAR